MHAGGKGKSKNTTEEGEEQIRRSDKVIAFIECLTNTAGESAGKQFILRDWQKDIIREIYDPVGEDGRRIVRTALLTMGRKNGKTELVAALCLAHLLGPESEINGQVYSAAVDREQASLVFRAARSMVLADEELSSRCNIIESTKRIVYLSGGSFYHAISSESKSKHGFNASCIIYDELAQAPNRDLFDVLTTSTSARAEPLTLVISTMSSNPLSVMSELVDYGKKVNEGIYTDPTFKTFIYAVPMDADIWKEENWYLANPALGDFRSLEEMRIYAEQAKRIPAREATFRSLYLNQSVDNNQRFISSVDWKSCEGEIDYEALKGKQCFGGLDLSATTDLTAFILYFPEEGVALSFFWLPEDEITEKAHVDKVPYDMWSKQYYLELTPGKVINKRFVVQRMAELSELYDIQCVAYDRWRIEEIKPLLEEVGVHMEMVPFGQGFKDMRTAVDALEEAIKEQKFNHGGHPVLTMCAANCVIVKDEAGSRKFNKAKSTGRIDGIVAAGMACAQAKIVHKHVEYDVIMM